jgi:predicted nucleotidyltransferase
MLTQDQIDKIIDELKQEPGVIGILLTGSYVYGTPNEASDLDVRCLVLDGYSKAEKRECFGVEVELYYNTPEKVRFYLKLGEDEGHGAAIHFWAHGKIVCDPQGIATQIQKEACEWWKRGRADGKPWEPRNEKYRKYS